MTRTPITLADVDPQLRGTLAKMPHVPVGNRVIRWIVRRALAKMPAADLGDVRLGLINADGIDLRVYHPPERRGPGALYWLHGGGFLIGRPAQDDRFCAEVARDLGLLVVSATYRLAPEHPFPAPLDDALAGWRWLRANATRFDVDPDRIAIGGMSAGAGLAAMLVQKAHDLGEGAAAQWLLCPMLDDRTAADPALDKGGHKVWTWRDNRAGWRAFLGREPGTPDMPPYAVPARRTDLSGLPPAFIGVGAIDLFRAEDAAYADRLRAAGVPVTFETVPGAPHGFEAWAFNTQTAQAYRATARAWLGRALHHS